MLYFAGCPDNFVVLFPRQFCLTLYHLDPISINYLLENSACFFQTIFGTNNDLLHFLALLVSKEECFLLFWLNSFLFQGEEDILSPCLDSLTVYLKPKHSNLYWCLCFILNQSCNTVLHQKNSCRHFEERLFYTLTVMHLIWRAWGFAHTQSPFSMVSFPVLLYNKLFNPFTTWGLQIRQGEAF